MAAAQTDASDIGASAARARRLSIMQSLTLIGIGSGQLDHLTGQARTAIGQADLILIPHKGAEKADLAHLREQIVRALRPNDPCTALFEMPERDAKISYLDRVAQWHDQIADAWTRTIAQHPEADHVAVLVWGDPSLYDSTLRIAARLDPKPQIKVIAGITSLQLLTAAHAIALNTVGAPVIITTGRQLRDHGWPDAAETVAVMLDGSCAFQNLDPRSLHIWWGAYLGMENELLISGPVAQVTQQIISTRACAKSEHGWIMDIYLLRKTV